MSATKVPEIISSTTAETPSTIYSFLYDSQVGVLSTVGTDGKPHATVVYFSIAPNFVCTFVTKKGTAKHKNLQNNNQAMLVVFDVNSQTTIQIMGTVEEVVDQQLAEAAYNHMLEAARLTSDGEAPPISKLMYGAFITYALIPASIQMRVFARPSLSSYDLHETIEFATKPPAQA